MIIPPLFKSIFVFCVLINHLFTDFEGFQTNPANGHPEFRFISEKQEIMGGFSQARFVIQQMGGEFTQDPELSAYVAYVGHRIAAVSDRPYLPYDFVIVNDSKPNAMCLPGGIILISHRMLLELKSEAELAAILAHEIGHASARHCAKGIERRWIFDLIGDPFALIPRWFGLGMTRNEEMEADYLGMEYMARAGYDVRAVISIADRRRHLVKKSLLPLELFKSHPSHDTRLQANLRHAEKFPLSGDREEETYQTMVYWYWVIRQV